jgi:23S rRNA (cytosine1962-C5)-methyltransferase
MSFPGIHLPSIPPASERRIALRVTGSAEHALRKEHPWLFANAITRQSHEGRPGDLAVIFDNQRKFLAIGLYDPTSPIRVRVLQHRKPSKIDQSWFAAKIAAAIQIREDLPSNTNAYRLVHGENDRLPGIVIDRYAQSLVLKIYTPAWIPYLDNLNHILNDMLRPERIILRLGRGTQRYPQFLYNLDDGTTIYGSHPDEPVLFLENGITFEADLVRGQKTGFFLDQRDNRARVEKISKNRRVLNVFSYTGGFSVYAARGGAVEVVNIDLSKPALDSARRNFSYNQSHAAIATCHQDIRAGDVFKIMKTWAEKNQQFEMVIIDPPSFAKKQDEISQAIATYQRLTHLGLGVLAPGGILVQASCSSRVSKSAFFNAIHRAAQVSQRPLTEIERTGHALDHPIGFREGEYLKCLFAIG